MGDNVGGRLVAEEKEEEEEDVVAEEDKEEDVAELLAVAVVRVVVVVVVVVLVVVVVGAGVVHDCTTAHAGISRFSCEIVTASMVYVESMVCTTASYSSLL